MSQNTDEKNMYVVTGENKTALRITLTDDAAVHPTGPISQLLRDNIKDKGTQTPSVYKTVTT